MGEGAGESEGEEREAWPLEIGAVVLSRAENEVIEVQAKADRRLELEVERTV